eukprot:GEMP01043776.1.p1 GENE.GEMP01043776.1~~GEMP01043776.1.p1  ORF type:complete len:288 (+),score=51.13 GEMP01043776.1:36-866(+)
MEFFSGLFSNHVLEYAAASLLCPVDRWRIYTQCRVALPTNYMFWELVEHGALTQWRTLPLVLAQRGLRSNLRPGFIKIATILGIPIFSWVLKALETIILFPLVHLRTVMVADVGGDVSVRSFCRDVGPLGVWRGIGLALVQCFRYQPAYSRMMKYLNSRSPWQEGIMGSISRLAIVSTSTLLGGFLTYPLDTMVRRLHARAFVGNPVILIEEIRWSFSSVQNVISLYDGYTLEFTRSAVGIVAILGTAFIFKVVEYNPDILDIFDADTLRRSARRR